MAAGSGFGTTVAAGTVVAVRVGSSTTGTTDPGTPTLNRTLTPTLNPTQLQMMMTKKLEQP